MISAWARMCKLLGKQFEQFLPLVMPSVMKTAAIKPEVALVESWFISHLLLCHRLKFRLSTCMHFFKK